MNNHRITKTWFWLMPVFSLGLSIGFIFMMRTLEHASGWSTLHDKVCERGVIPYLIVFFTFLTLGYTVLAGRYSEVGSPVLIGLFGCSFFPVLWGGLGSLMGWTMAWAQQSAFSSMMGSSADIKEIQEAIAGYSHAMGMMMSATDPLFLGVISMMITWPFILWLCFRPVRTP